MEASPTPGRKCARERIRSRQPVFGFMQSLPASMVTELAIWCGFDFVVLDCEHSVVDERAQLASLQIISGSHALSVVRVRSGDLDAVSRYLDFGADAIMLPGVRTASDVEAFVAAATHGPTGTRSSTGVGSRASRYGLAADGERSQPLLLAMIERAQAVENISRIVATPRLDGVIIGPQDLSADLGCSNDFSTPAYRAAFAAAEQAAFGAGLLLGSKPHPGFPVERLLSGGHRLIVTSGDIAALRDGCRTHLAAARGALA